MANTILAGAAYFTGISLAIEKANKAAVTRSARLIRDEAKRVLGTYDYGWTPLAESTIARKARGDSPLLETGAMRRSIKYSVSGERGHWVAHVGSNDPKARWHELGTARIPPRSFLAGASKQQEHKVHEICGHRLFHFAFHSSSHSDSEDEYGNED